MSKAQNKITEKKQQLESNLARIQEGLDQSIDNVKGGMVESLSPKEVVKKYPLPVLGVALLLGFLLGSKGGSTKKSSSSTSSTFVDSIGKSLKKRIVQKAIDSALDFIDEKLKEPKEE
tara:strand:- start:5964 stop:6317 length:354 start_codon:yes stop_codon:yes gene_type:complete